MSKQRAPRGCRREVWQKIVDNWRTSGVSVRRFCRQQGLTESAFYTWRKRLASAASADSGLTLPLATEPTPFLEITLPAASGPSPAPLELALCSGALLRIPAGVDRATLSAVLAVLHGEGLC
jgi:transposase-like protein